MFEELVVQHRPNQRPHQIGRAVDEIWLVDAIDQHEDSVEVHRAEHALKLREQLVAVVGPRQRGQRLADDLPAGEIQQRAAEQFRAAVQHAGVASDLPCLPPPVQQPPAARRPAGRYRQIRQPMAKPRPVAFHASPNEQRHHRHGHQNADGQSPTSTATLKIGASSAIGPSVGTSFRRSIGRSRPPAASRRAPARRRAIRSAALRRGPPDAAPACFRESDRPTA